MSVDFLRTQSPIGGGGFLGDPFLELNGAFTTPTAPKSSKLASACISDGALAGAIVGTLILSAFIGFLIWLIYLRPKFQEFHARLSHGNQRVPHIQLSPSSISMNHKHSNKKQQINDDYTIPQLPLDVTDYKFGTFPFRQSQISNGNGHYNRTDWLCRPSASFRSMNIDQDFEMIDIELLEPTFGGLNFSITGNMRAGIFVKEILNRGQINSHPSNQLRTGDRITALTVCFESIVYEDALTILSYASPYPVILRIQRPSNHVKVHVSTEKRPTTATTSSKVRWRDDFEHYDNDSSRSYIQPNRAVPPLPVTVSKVPSTPLNRSSSKKTSAQSRQNTKPSSSTNKGSKMKNISTNVLPTSDAPIKRSHNDLKKQRSKPTNQPMLTSTGLTLKPPTRVPTPPRPANKKPVKSVTDAVISYLHYKGAAAENSTGVVNHSEAAVMPYYDSPYDYYYGGQVSQYQYLHQSHLNKNNNNSLSAESLTAVTPNLATSIYTLHFSSRRSSLPVQRRCERRLSSPAIISNASMVERTMVNENENSLNNIDTFV